ncbi:ABC transporter permease [Rhodococcoides fascians]|uniref:ABC transporter permease n=1 Tax=Rhodococcoides fascians TaxID=1828 RepID=UPI000B9BDD52|nr:MULTISPECIES: ABC transporter permease [Rhodococcus]OZD69004.1 ABC transporter permease [Rhodococcus sp. 06-1059B-a]OZE81325.1 ABC transporter permease [Rhodococcus fascians]OZF08512.1 ABC transporter permease [Rhodococcus fascians]OZF10927.1 ABC transporter permease [Rhodococcus fascians]OZF59110.1 ABC transporter permease [Rhodococcus fascians]
MLTIVAKRLALSIPLLLLVSAVTFVLIALLPGDAAQVVAGKNATADQIAQTRTQLGLDLPLWRQYTNWLGNAVTGDLGASLVNRQPVADQLAGRLGPTLSLIVGATLVAAIVGVAFGVLGARGGALGKTVDALAVVGLAVPTFWLGLILVVLLAVKVNAFPALGYVPLTQSPSQWMASLVLPVVTLAVPATAAIAKQTRDAVADALERPFTRTLRAAGATERSILLRHALKNAAVPVLTVLGLTFVGALSGAIAIESIFALPGLGGTAVQATASGDIPLIQGVVLFFTVIVIAVNLIVDIAYGYFNPKVRVS